MGLVFFSHISTGYILFLARCHYPKRATCRLLSGHERINIAFWETNTRMTRGRNILEGGSFGIANCYKEQIFQQR